jgi:hypothetical protein
MRSLWPSLGHHPAGDSRGLHRLRGRLAGSRTSVASSCPQLNIAAHRAGRRVVLAAFSEPTGSAPWSPSPVSSHQSL